MPGAPKYEKTVWTMPDGFFYYYWLTQHSKAAEYFRCIPSTTK
jgi:hypothetical protein